MPGALEPIDQNDIGPHGFIEGEYNEGKLSISFVPWACREYIPLELDTKECPTNGISGDSADADGSKGNAAYL